MIDQKKGWFEDWSYEPELELESVSYSSAGTGVDSCSFTRKYGEVRPPWESGFVLRKPLTVLDAWIRVRIPVEDDFETVFIGRIDADSRDVWNSGHIPTPEGEPDPENAKGVQSFTAYGPLRTLQKADITGSVWIGSDFLTEDTLDRVEDVNGRDQRRLLVGNRTTALSGETYLFGGDELWTHDQFATYLLKRFVEDLSPSGDPKWRLAGAVEAISERTDLIQVNTGETVAEVLAKLIPNQIGLDYVIQPYKADPEDEIEEGFELWIFALSDREWSFGNATLPSNPNTLQVDSPRPRFAQSVILSNTQENEYDRIRVVGEPYVVACSLEGDLVPGGNQNLVPKWSASTEVDYLDAGGGTAEERDAIRRRDFFRQVYRQFGAPVDWNHNSGDAAPLVDFEGNLLVGEIAPFQNKVRETLRWLPMREGFDYTVDPPIDLNAGNAIPDQLSATAWIYDQLGYARYFPCEAANISVSVSGTDWGVFLFAEPNHILGLDHLDPVLDPSLHRFPVFDYEESVATIAFRSDLRLTLGVDVDSKRIDASVKVIEVADAEFWYLAPNTVVGVAEDGSLERSPATPVVLRNDSDRMALIMAGALSRYFDFRARAEIAWIGYIPTAAAVGFVLTVVDDGGFTNHIHAPITSVTWTRQSDTTGETRLRAGFAQ